MFTKLNLNDVQLTEKLNIEIQRLKKLQGMLLGTTFEIYIKDIDVHNYAKFILLEGSIDEDREFLRCLKSKILLKNKKISLL